MFTIIKVYILKFIANSMQCFWTIICKVITMKFKCILFKNYIKCN